MKRKKPETTEKGKRGVGSLVKLSATKARMDFEDDTQIPVEISEETIPEILLKVLNKVPDNGKVNVEVTFDESEKKILYVKPLVGTFDLKFLKFYAPKDQKPAIEMKKGKGNSEYGMFSAVLEVQKKTGTNSDLWNGVQYNVFFFDAFDKDEDGNLVVLSKGDASDFLSDFLDVIGVASHTIPYSENPLPDIEKIALREAKIFSADVRKTVSKKGESYANVVMFNTYTDDLADYVDDTPAEEKDEVHPALADE